jgi:hypothetical protein
MNAQPKKIQRIEVIRSTQGILSGAIPAMHLGIQTGFSAISAWFSLPSLWFEAPFRVKGKQILKPERARRNHAEIAQEPPCRKI